MLDPSFPETYWQINNPETVGKTQPGGRDEVGGAEPLSLLLSRRAGLWGMVHNSWGKARSFSKSRGSLRSSSVDTMEASRPNNRRMCLWPGFPSGSAGKMQGGDAGSVPGLGRSPGGGHGNSLQYSCLENLPDCSLAGYSPWGRTEPDTTEVASHSTAHTYGWEKYGQKIAKEEDRAKKRDGNAYNWQGIWIWMLGGEEVRFKKKSIWIKLFFTELWLPCL